MPSWQPCWRHSCPWQDGTCIVQRIVLQGAVFILCGTTLAALLAYSLSRGVGRRLAERVIAEEVGESGRSGAINSQ